MVRKPLSSTSAADFIPEHPTLETLREAVQHCRGCDLWEHATQAVFGEGARHARVMLVGEQPGDKEDLSGKPFVGPAGGVLDRALDAVGVDRRQTYVTNAVKHFKWEPRGKRRIHKKPNTIEITACRAWLDEEITMIAPEVVVCLGATAAQSLLGRTFRVTRQRGQLLPLRPKVQALATVHPSSILRAIDDESREREMQLFIDDLRVVAKVLKKERAA